MFVGSSVRLPSPNISGVLRNFRGLGRDTRASRSDFSDASVRDPDPVSSFKCMCDCERCANVYLFARGR